VLEIAQRPMHGPRMSPLHVRRKDRSRRMGRAPVLDGRMTASCTVEAKGSPCHAVGRALTPNSRPWHVLPDVSTSSPRSDAQLAKCLGAHRSLATFGEPTIHRDRWDPAHAVHFRLRLAMRSSPPYRCGAEPARSRSCAIASNF
jgi:hypothetical protein